MLLLLPLAGALGGLGLLEGLLRLTGVGAPPRHAAPFVAPHPDLGWFPIPGHRFVYASPQGEYRVEVAFNSRGLRDREHPYAKPPGTARVLLLGDSFTAALEVPLEATFAERLERTVRLPQRGFEVVNAGVQGWGTDQQLLYFRHEGHRYGPDLVLVQFYVNDVHDNSAGLAPHVLRGRKPFFTLTGGRLVLRPAGDRPGRRPGWSGRVRAWLSGWRVVEAAVQARRALAHRGRATACAEQEAAVPRRMHAYGPQLPAEEAGAWRLTFRILEALRDEVALRGGRLALLYIPEKRQVFPDLWAAELACYPTEEVSGWDPDGPNRRLGTFLAGAGVPFLDLTPPLRAAARRGGRPYFTHDVHLTPSGHAIVAETVRRWIAEAELLERGGAAGGRQVVARP